VESNEYYTRLSIRSNRILAGMIFYFQVAIIILYGFLVLVGTYPLMQASDSSLA
jgi:hypothetical protein